VPVDDLSKPSGNQQFAGMTAPVLVSADGHYPMMGRLNACDESSESLDYLIAAGQFRTTE